MVFFIEGLDCTGKSTLIDNLINSFKFASPADKFIYHHFDKPLGNTDEERFGYQYGQFQLMFDWISKPEMKHTHWVFDRSHIGEYVYGPMWRKRDPEYLKKLEEEFLEKYQDKCLLVYLTCDPSQIQFRFNNFRKHEECPSLKEITKTKKLFDSAVEKSVLPKITIDTTNTNEEDTAMAVLNEMHTRYKIEE
jgi:thymidylate kinase